jgi:hypothetical protein
MATALFEGSCKLFSLYCWMFTALKLLLLSYRVKWDECFVCIVNCFWSKKDYWVKKCSVTILVNIKAGRTSCAYCLWISVVWTTHMTYNNIHLTGWTRYITLLIILIMDFSQLMVILQVSGTGQKKLRVQWNIAKTNFLLYGSLGFSQGKSHCTVIECSVPLKLASYWVSSLFCELHLEKIYS